MAFEDLGTNFGASFAPTREAAASARTRPTPSPLQQAVQILSLRLPRTGLERAPVPEELLRAPAGRGASLSSAVVRSVMASMFGPQAAAALDRPSVPQATLPSVPPSVPEGMASMFGPQAAAGPGARLPSLPSVGGATAMASPPWRRRTEMQALMDLLSSAFGGSPSGAGASGAGLGSSFSAPDPHFRMAQPPDDIDSLLT